MKKELEMAREKMIIGEYLDSKRNDLLYGNQISERLADYAACISLMNIHLDEALILARKSGEEAKRYLEETTKKDLGHIATIIIDPEFNEESFLEQAKVNPDHLIPHYRPLFSSAVKNVQNYKEMIDEISSGERNN